MIPSWLYLSLTAVGLWGLWGLQSKLVSSEGPWHIGPYANHVLSTAGLFCVLPALFLSWGAAPRRGRLRGGAAAIVSGIVGSVGNILVYRALDLGGLASVVFPLSGLYPIVTIVLAVTLLRERLSLPQILGLPISICAIYLLSLEPTSSAGQVSSAMLRETWLALACGSLVLWGLSGTLQKVATGFLSPQRTFALFALGYLVTASYLLAVESLALRSLEWSVLALGIAGGLLNGLGVLALLAALARGGKASVVVPLTALYPVVTMGLAMALLGESPGMLQKLGAIGAVAGGMLLAVEKTGAVPDAHEGRDPRDSTANGDTP